MAEKYKIKLKDESIESQVVGLLSRAEQNTEQAREHIDNIVNIIEPEDEITDLVEDEAVNLSNELYDIQVKIIKLKQKIRKSGLLKDSKFKDIDWGQTSSGGKNAKREAKKDKQKRGPRGTYKPRVSNDILKKGRGELNDSENTAYQLISEGKDLVRALSSLNNKINHYSSMITPEFLEENEIYKTLVREGKSKINRIKRYYEKHNSRG